MDSLPLYLAGHWARYRLTGQRRPLLAGFKLTHRCNLRCRTCPFWRRPRPDLSFDAVQAALDELYRAGCRILVLEGGEPFLWRDGERRLDDVIAAARARGFKRVGVTTNGTLPIAVAADIVWISLDGLRASHEANRGPVWDTVMANLAASKHPRIFVQMTITRENWREAPELIRLLAGRVAGVTIQFFYPFPESDDLWLPWPERRQVLRELAALKRAGYPVVDSYPVLRALEDNSWRCHDWLIADAEPGDDPSAAVIHYGCYLKGRAAVDCRRCGFAAHAELSLAYDLNPGALLTGQRVFRLLS
ncbi:MAG: Antilisterial bacteriocin subtilosin biosynthesis protein AlbA [Chloroflexi bacterium ADurb.Bin325]|nr:MAG: Antilisterial bacteriocin subtilosin biosynthesis protein AlbA [Chloroflexi bacterium ADurb.Bin325]